ncbi:topology modulation protein [Virgibacillus sp. 179-BFC.A HS]|uniref:Topology modulation protein n=1 Tax=Tigheibacillus jepli TaxID=3035914 RepID=A0ABU5CMV5_9BACI|nr:topology modulation protein [Virgibacillus sp. 179-BFC.A HS]MDY0406778.1 topology modulation protein [Virgibacillus sp. 179-BFC.A HS]
MNKIMVIGVSAGAGKSTLARELGQALNIEVHHLDTVFWKPGWVQATLDEFASAQRKIVETNNRWVIEGNYSNTYEIRAEHADTIIYLELPLYVCLYRVLKRWLKNRGKERLDLGKGCPDKMDWDFISFICRTYYPRKIKMRERLQRFQKLGPEKTVYVLKGKKEIDAFIMKIKAS